MGPVELLYRLRQTINVFAIVVGARLFPARFARADHDISAFGFFSGTTKMPELEFDLGKLPSIDRLLSGELDVLGCEWAWDGTRECWHRAPDTQRQWPLQYCMKVPYRPGNPVGDLRIAWEPSRLQHLISLALIAETVDSDQREMAWDLVARQLDSWCEANPFPLGIHYISAMECALRIITVSLLLSRLPPDLSGDGQFERQGLCLIEGHARWIHARISLHSSAGNHTITECAGLVFAGVLFPELRGSGNWLDTGLQILAEEAQRQVLPDGGGIEQAPHYLEFIVDLLVMVDGILEDNDQSTPVEIKRAVSRAESFLLALGRGFASQIGDSDDGVALSQAYKRPVSSKEKITEKQEVREFPDSGYDLYSSPGQGNIRALFDYGRLGMAPCYGHGHADCLSFLLEYDGQPVFVDTGTFTYNGDQSLRRYFKGTPAHNTVCVGGADQSLQVSAFLWEQPFNAEAVPLKPDSGVVFERFARHDGYASRFGVIHSRVVRAYSENQWVIWDFLSGEGHQELTLNWHIPMQISNEGQDIILRESARKVRLRIQGGTISRETASDSGPGWLSPSYGRRVPVTTVSASYNGELPHTFRTEIYLGDVEVVLASRLGDDTLKLQEAIS